MASDDPLGVQLRSVLTSRQRQELLNRHERAWLKTVLGLGLSVGHHPFLSAGDSEVVEARFFERLRRGVPFERSLAASELAAACEDLALLSSLATDRAVIVFSSNPGVLGAFMTSSSDLMPKLEALAATTGHELGIMSPDAAHGLAIERSFYSEAGDYVPEGLLLLRGWGAFASEG